MIERGKIKLFGVEFYYAICHLCKCWVRSGVGQPGWMQVNNRDYAIEYHNRKWHGHE